MTELAYLADIDAAYVRSFSARVVSLPPGGVVLERTYFYPGGGGQPCDAGGLVVSGGAGLEVPEVFKSGAAVVHRVRGRPAAVRSLGVGSEVEGTIDWARRHRHMRLHTAQHFASARAFARWDRRTRRASFQGLRAVLDLDGTVPEGATAVLLEDLRDAVTKPRAVTVRQVPRAEWDRAPESARSGLVPLPPQVDPVRVIVIEDADVCPCGGTHLRTTGEIGSLSFEPPAPLSDGGVRLAFSLEPTAPTGPPA